MSLLQAPWWGAFVSGLRHRSVAGFAVDLGVSEDALVAALVEADAGGPAEAAPWWPEALRLRGTLSIRALALRFGCEPRRVRRALARTGRRVGGEDLDGRGVPALRPFRERLGREPDAGIARAAGVSIEAVQGERRRLGVPAFYPSAAAPLLSPEEEAWIRGPEPTRRGRLRPEQEVVQVVRRPLGRGDLPGEPPRERLRDVRPPPARDAVEGEGRTEAPRSDAAEARTDEPHRLSRTFFRSTRDEELARLLEPGPRARDGRQRIVRAPLPRSAPGAGEGPAAGEAFVAAAPVAVVAPEEPSRPEVVAPAEPSRSKAAPVAAVAPAEPSRSEAAPVAAVAPAEPSRPEVVVASEPAERSPAPRAPSPRPARAPSRPSPRPRARPAPAAPRAPAAPAADALRYAWAVSVPGLDAPLVVHAPDLLGAVRLAAQQLPASDLARASVALTGHPPWRPDPQLVPPLWEPARLF